MASTTAAAGGGAQQQEQLQQQQQQQQHQLPPQQSSMAGLSRWVPSLPTINLTALNAFVGGGGNDSKQSANDPSKLSSAARRPILSAILASASVDSAPPSPSRSSTSVMFAEPDSGSNAGSNESREGSINAHRRKRNHKPKTRYSICHPPPASHTRQKLHRRPRSLLQLHELSCSRRPQPAFEVIPSANFSVRLTRSITKVFKSKHGLCPNDLVVLRAEKYGAVDEEMEEEAAHVIGLICCRREKEDNAPATAKVKICVSNGQEWEAHPLTNGGYEFVSTDKHGLGLTVRWVPKRHKDGSKMKCKRFNFSTISPNSRRHPVIASLSKTGLDVYDTYKMPDPSAASPVSTPKAKSTSLLAEAMEEEECTSEQCETDKELREVITMTGIWVTFKEGWSPFFRYDEGDREPSGSTPRRSVSMNNGSAQHSPSKSIILSSTFSSPPASPRPGALEKRASIRSIRSSIFRSSSLLARSNRNSQISITESEAENLGRSGSIKKTGRPRADSAGTVLVHQAANNRRKAATWRPDLIGVKQQALNETSREDLSCTPPRRDTKDWNTTPTHDNQAYTVAPPLIPGPSEALAGSSKSIPVARAESPRNAKRRMPTLEAESETENGKSERSASIATQSTLNGSSTPAEPAKYNEVAPSANSASPPAQEGYSSIRRKGRKRPSGWRNILLCGKHDI